MTDHTDFSPKYSSLICGTSPQFAVLDIRKIRQSAVLYRLETRDELFEQLKPIAYHQLQQQVAQIDGSI